MVFYINFAELYISIAILCVGYFKVAFRLIKQVAFRVMTGFKFKLPSSSNDVSIICFI